MAARGFDSVYRSTIMKPIIPRIFSNGLGNPLLLEHLVTNFQYFRDPQFIGKFLTEKYGRECPIKITKRTVVQKKYEVLEGTFGSPFNELVPNSLPKEATTAYFKMLVPQAPTSSRPQPLVLHLAGTGDYSVTLQEYHADRLSSHGVASLLLMNPFYRNRRPPQQKSSSLLHMSDLFVMGGSLILECWLLLRWLESQGYGPLALHGISLGGFMASLAASVYNRPLPLVPCLSWTTSSPCYVRGVLSNSMSWDVIRRQLAQDRIFKERLWPRIRDASCPPAYRVPPTLVDPLRPQPQPPPASPTPSSPEAAGANSNGPTEAQSLRTRIYSSVSGLGFGLFAAGGRMADTLMQTLRQPQFADAMEAKHKQQHLASSSASRDPELTPEDQETREFVVCLLDYFTHMGNYEKPLGPVYSLQALDDAYIPRDGVYPLMELWPGTECRVVKGGHVTTILKNCHWASNSYDMRDIVLRAVGVSAEKPVGTQSSRNPESV